MKTDHSASFISLTVFQTLFFRLILLLPTAVCLVGGACAALPAKTLDTNDIKAMRRQAAAKQRRIIFNNDGCDALYFPAGWQATPENLLARRTSPLLGSQVDVVSYCTVSSGFSNFTHNTRIGHVLTVSPPQRSTKNITQDLIDQGTDPLKVMVDFCHKNNLEIFWSMRMNDTHDEAQRPDKPFFLFPPLKAQHPEYLISSLSNQPLYGSWTAVDYTLPQVRRLAVEFIREVCENYDIDGLDLDFFRHLCYFKRVAFGGRATQAERDMMTDMMRRVRKAADRAGLRCGRPILIAVRVPDSVAYSRAIGLDIERWLAEDLVDILIPSGYFRLNPWDYSVRLAHQYGVRAYPCITDSRVGGEDKKFSRQDQRCFRARAMEAWLAHPDGIYVYNDYNARARYLREIGDPQQLQRLDKIYFATVMNGRAGQYLAGGNKFMNLKLLTPIDKWPLLPRTPLQVEIVIGDDFSWLENEPQRAEVKCFLRFTGLRSAESIVASLNDRPLQNGQLSDQWLAYPVAPTMVKKGVNRIRLSFVPQALDAVDQPETETWNMVYNCDHILRPSVWRRLFKSSNWVEAIRNGALYFADRAAGRSEWAGLAYPWQVIPGSRVVVEAKCKVESSTDPLAVCIRVSDGQSVEYLTLQERGIGLKYAGLTCALDTTSDFHIYRIVMDGTTIKVFVDGRLKLDGTGKFTTPALDKTKWIDFMGGLRDWNQNCLFFGSATGPGTGAANWQYIKFRASARFLLDAVMTISYKTLP